MRQSVGATGFPSKMRALRRIVLWTVVLLVVVAPGGIQAKIQCYVCDWNMATSSADNSSANVDTCSPHNFQPEKAATVDCDGGCEAKSYKDKKNNVLIHFFRNCVVSSGGRLEDRCYTTDEKASHFYTTCECATNLCNSSDRTSPFTSLLLSLLFISFSLALASNYFYR